MRSPTYPNQAIGDVASNPLFVVSWIGFTGGSAGAGVGVGSGPLCGPPGVGVGGGLGGGGVYASLGRNHSWNGPAATPGARNAIPDPSGAHVGCATSRFVRMFVRGPSVEPFHEAMLRYETCFPYVHTIASWLPAGESDGVRQS